MVYLPPPPSITQLILKLVTFEREGGKYFWNLIATLYNCIDTNVPYCMKYIVSFPIQAVGIGNGARETLILQKNRLRMPYTLKITIKQFPSDAKLMIQGGSYGQQGAGNSVIAKKPPPKLGIYIMIDKIRHGTMYLHFSNHVHKTYFFWMSAL